MNNPKASEIKNLCDEKGIPLEDVIEAVEAALAAAYRKDFGEKNQNIKVKFDIKTGGFDVFDVKHVVEDMDESELEAVAQEPVDHVEGEEEKKRFNPKTDIMVSDARLLKEDAEVGEEIKTQLPPHSDEFGRMAAQTAKQVLIQKIREAERNILFDNFKDKEDTIMIGTVQRREDTRVLVDFGRVTAVLPISEQIPRERYNQGERVKVYVVSVGSSSRGPEIIVSRSHPNMVKKIFESEIPEIASGAIEVRRVSREPGFRSKVAVVSHQENIDPIGSCIGQRGSRIQTIIAELAGEKIDIIQFDEDAHAFIANALSPAKISSMTLTEGSHTARVLVPQDQLSLAIGKMGQNVRLASQLTGWNIEVESDGVPLQKEVPDEEVVAQDDPMETMIIEPDDIDSAEEKADQKREINAEE